MSSLSSRRDGSVRVRRSLEEERLVEGSIKRLVGFCILDGSKLELGEGGKDLLFGERFRSEV
jgi:hypothetical protein